MHGSALHDVPARPYLGMYFDHRATSSHCCNCTRKTHRYQCKCDDTVLESLHTRLRLKSIEFYNFKEKVKCKSRFNLETDSHPRSKLHYKSTTRVKHTNRCQNSFPFCSGNCMRQCHKWVPTNRHHKRTCPAQHIFHGLYTKMGQRHEEKDLGIQISGGHLSSSAISHKKQQNSLRPSTLCYKSKAQVQHKYPSRSSPGSTRICHRCLRSNRCNTHK